MNTQQKGVAAIEFVIVLPLILAVFFAITEFGRAIYTYNTLAKSVRSAARYLSTQDPDKADTYPGVLVKARKIIAYGNPIYDCNKPEKKGGESLVPGLDCNNMASLVSISNKTLGSSPVINTVTVTITGYQFNPIMDLLEFTRLYTGGAHSITAIPFGDISVTMRQES